MKRRPKGEGSIIQRKDGRWAYVVDLGKDAEGKRVRRTIYALSRAELLRKVADLRAKGGGSIKPRAAGTIGEMVERWLREDVKPNLSPTTASSYEGTWKRYVAPKIASRKLEAFDIGDAHRLLAALRAEGYSGAILDRVLVVMRRVYNVAIRRQQIHGVNPFAFVERKELGYKPREPKALTEREARRFLDAAKGDRLEALWVLLLTSGLRIGEALTLEWSDIDLKRRTLSVRRGLVEVGGVTHVRAPKTESSKRLVELGATTVEALKERRKAWESEPHGSPLVFSTVSGRPLLRANLRRRHFDPIVRRAGLEGLTIHGLRHSMTSLGLAAGISPKVMAERLGHTTTRMTMDRYSHVLPGLQREAADAIERAVRGARRSK